ncbi:hypothetical protein OH76DRAFT_1237383 [Lentinus brumalis]|uniref:Uncharacterized protein n=1 Tax=Lentinus brumalis TaxID=2498619 RepID=A0A371CSB3_9APHY|nr:hypothetical protein OH76DRAFT_1237383 [Polyporus brumalis]
MQTDHCLDLPFSLWCARPPIAQLPDQPPRTVASARHEPDSPRDGAQRAHCGRLVQPQFVRRRVRHERHPEGRGERDADEHEGDAEERLRGREGVQRREHLVRIGPGLGPLLVSVSCGEEAAGGEGEGCAEECAPCGRGAEEELEVDGRRRPDAGVDVGDDEPAEDAEEGCDECAGGEDADAGEEVVEGAGGVVAVAVGWRGGCGCIG